MATPTYDNDALDFSVDTSELESGKLDDDGEAVLSPGPCHPVGPADTSRRAVPGEEDGECGSDVENGNVEAGTTAAKSAKFLTIPVTSAKAKKQEDGELEEGECDDDDDNSGNKVTRRTGLTAVATDATADTTAKPVKQGVCVHFLKRTCTWGDNCRYLHPAPARSTTSGYVLFEELEQARQQNKPNAVGQRRVGGALNASSPDKTVNSSRVPVHSRLGEGGLRGGGRVGGSLLSMNAAVSNAFVPMPFTLPKQETAWEAGLRKVSETQNFVQKRRERAEDMQLGITNAAVDTAPSILAKSVSPMAAVPALPLAAAAAFIPDSSKVASSLSSVPVFPENPSKMPNLIIRAPIHNDASGNHSHGHRRSPDRFVVQQNVPVQDELTITISNRTNNAPVIRRISPGSDLTDKNNDITFRGTKHPPFDHSRPSVSRRIGHPSVAADDVDFPPPPPHLQPPNNMPLNSDEQRRYERQLSHYFPSRKYYMNLDSKPHDDNSSNNGGGVVASRFNPRNDDSGSLRLNNNNNSFDRQFGPRVSDLNNNQRPSRYDQSINNIPIPQQQNWAGNDVVGPPAGRRPMVNRNSSLNADNSSGYPDAAAGGEKEESALEVARRRHLERQRQQHQQHEQQPPAKQQQQQSRQQSRKISRNSSNMSNISASSREQSLDVVSDSEEKQHMHRHKRHHESITSEDTRRPRNHQATPSDVSNNNGAIHPVEGGANSTHSSSTFGDEHRSPDKNNSGSNVSLSPVPPADAVADASRKRTTASTSSINESLDDLADSNPPTTSSRRRRNQNNRSPTNTESPASPVSSKAATQPSPNRKQIMQQQRGSPLQSKTAPLASSASSTNITRTKRQPVKLTINNSKRVKSSSVAVFDDDGDDVVEQQRQISVEDDSYESIGNSDDETPDVVAPRTGSGSKNNGSAQPLPAAAAAAAAPAAAISPHDREELLRQLRVIEEEIAAKRRRAATSAATSS